MHVEKYLVCFTCLHSIAGYLLHTRCSIMCCMNDQRFSPVFPKLTLFITIEHRVSLWFVQQPSSTLCLFGFFKICLLERQTDLYLLVHSPNSCNIQGWARPEPGAKNSILFSHMGGRVPSAWTIFCCTPRCIRRKLDQKQSSWKANWNSHVGCRSLPCCTTVPATMLSLS